MTSAELSDCELACVLARNAGQMLIRLRRHFEGMPVARDQLGAVADRRAHDFLASEFARLRPMDVLLSEESSEPVARLDAPRVWIVDPLDGTAEFAAGRNDFAVHVALVEAGQVTASAVGLPAQDHVLCAGAGQASPAKRPRTESPLVVSRSRRPAFASAVADTLGVAVEAVGSAGVKVARVIEGSARAYVHAGGINEWDVAAPAGVALGAGLAVTGLKGQPIRFNQPDTVLRDGLVVCWPEDLQAILRAVAVFGLGSSA
ncbi:MAG: 3'(2'),5'-bisphosphate nucleotidase CysQ [Casimicrobiaceae bacterium]